MNIRLGLMAHRKREEYVPGIESAVPLDFISWDEGNLGLVQAHVQAWEMFEPDEGDVCILLQDDIILTKNFIPKLEHHVNQCIRRYGRIAMHLYLRNQGRKNVRMAVERCKRGRGDHWINEHLYSGNSIGLPAEHIRPMLDHFKTMDVPSGDQRIESYLNKNRINVYFPLPNLVEHRSLDSLHAGNVSSHEFRRSIWFIP